jgi:hypothetical protein
MVLIGTLSLTEVGIADVAAIGAAPWDLVQLKAVCVVA